MGVMAAVDIGGTKTLVEIFCRSEETSRSVEFPTPHSGRISEILANATCDLLPVEKNLKSVAVGCPGPLDSQRGIVLNPPNLSREWWGLHLSSELAEKFSCPVALENDANLGALGEAVYGAGQGHNSVLYLTISTGIGAGLVVDGDIFGGSRGFAGELGHITVVEKGRLCGCGRRGCLEAVASGSAIARRAAELGWVPQDGTGADARMVALEAAKGISTARQVLVETAGHLARAIVNFLYAYDPAAVVLGGGVAQSNLFVELVREAVADEAMMPAFRGVPVIKAALGNRSVICGARHLAERPANKVDASLEVP